MKRKERVRWPLSPLVGGGGQWRASPARHVTDGPRCPKKKKTIKKKTKEKTDGHRRFVGRHFLRSPFSAGRLIETSFFLILFFLYSPIELKRRIHQRGFHHRRVLFFFGFNFSFEDSIFFTPLSIQ